MKSNRKLPLNFSGSIWYTTYERVIAMQKFIPTQKLSKKAQRELNRAKRRTWGALNPTTKKPANPRAYNRQKVQKGDDYSLHFEPFCFIFQLQPL